MTTLDEYTLLPWVLVDADLVDEDPETTALPAVARHIRRFCSVMIGELDLEHVREQALRTGQHAARILYEALRDVPIATVGLSIDEPASINVTRKPLGAILATTRIGVEPSIDVARDWVHFGSDAYLRSEEREAIEERHQRPYESFRRDRIWTEVLEPFTRTRVLNIYDRYLFRRVFTNYGRIASTRRQHESGLGWLLDKLALRAGGEPISVAVRSEMIDAEIASEAEIRGAAEAFVDHWAPRIDLRLDFCSGRTPHDRFMFAHTPLGNVRVLEQSNSLLEKLGSKDHVAQDVLRLTFRSSDSATRAAIRDWERAGERLALSVGG